MPRIDENMALSRDTSCDSLELVHVRFGGEAGPGAGLGALFASAGAFIALPTAFLSTSQASLHSLYYISSCACHFISKKKE